MKRILLSCLIAVLFVLSLSHIVSAASPADALPLLPLQAEDPDDGDEETPEEGEDDLDEEEEINVNHPIWQLFKAFYEKLFAAPVDDELEGEEPVDEGEEPAEGEGELDEEDGFVLPEDNEDGWGWGLVAKMFGYYVMSQEECEGEEVCEPLDFAAVQAYIAEGGKLAPGQLFKEFGKPEFMGVGHIRKAMEAMEDAEDDDDLEDPEEGDLEVDGVLGQEDDSCTNQGNGRGVPGWCKDKDKDKDKDKGKN